VIARNPVRVPCELTQVLVLGARPLGHRSRVRGARDVRSLRHPSSTSTHTCCYVTLVHERDGLWLISGSVRVCRRLTGGPAADYWEIVKRR